MRNEVKDYVKRMKEQFDLKGEILELCVGNREWTVTGMFKEEGTRIYLHEWLEAEWTDFHGDITNENVQIPKDRFDVVLMLETLEHVDDMRAAVRNATSFLKPGGVLIMTTHGTWPIHRYPKDCWRVMPDGMEVLTRDFLEQLDLTLDSSGPFVMDPQNPSGVWFTGRRK